MKSAGHGIWIFVCLRPLKVVSATFSLVCFLSLKESTWETRKNVFLFHFKSSFRSRENQILEFEIFKFHDVILPEHRTRNKFYGITREVNSLLMEFDQFMSYHKRKRFIRKLYENCSLKTSPRPFYACKELGIPLLENETFEASYSH